MENNNPPASWSALKDALQSLPAKNIQTAIDVLLTYKQPSADTYRFLTRAVELAQKNTFASRNRTLNENFNS